MKALPIIFACSLALSCTSLPKRDQFLFTSYAPWNAYLDEVVNVDMDVVPMGDFLGAPPFENLNAIIHPGVGAEPAKEGAPFTDVLTQPEVHINLHADGITRREALRRISQQTGFKMTWAMHEGIPRSVLMTPE